MDLGVVCGQLGGPPMIAHHLVGVTCLVSALYLDACHFYALFTLTSECTTPFINLRWWLVKSVGYISLIGSVQTVCWYHFADSTKSYKVAFNLQHSLCLAFLKN